MPDRVAYIGVGSNISPETNIPRALELLATATHLIAISTFYRTEPLGDSQQPPFLNGVAKILTSQTPRVLKDNVLRSIEAQLGRIRTENKYAPRPIDLDILIIENTVSADPGIHLPDPDIRTRSFVAVPLLELAPELLMPDTLEPLSGLSSSKNREGLSPAAEFTTMLKERLGL